MIPAGTVAAAAMVLTLTLGACGGPADSGPNEGSKPADQVIADTKAAIRSAHSYHLVYQETARGGRSTAFDLSIAGPGRLSGSLTLDGIKLDLVVDGDTAYLHGKDFFQRSSGPAAAAAIGDRWVVLTAAQAAQFTGVLGVFADTSRLADCLLGSAGHGTLSVSTTFVEGRSVAEVEDKGDAPGAAPGILDVADTGPTYPIRLRRLGPRTPGGPPRPATCSAADSSTSASSSTSSADIESATATFDSWNTSVTVTAPPSPLDLATLGR